MVAIALYRANLHRVPNAPPRRWPVSPRSISIVQFKSLLRRRYAALSRLAPDKEESETEEQIDDSNSKEEIVEKQIDKEKKDEQNDVKEEQKELDPPVKEEIPIPDEKSEQKKQLEQKLSELNQKKHNLVQMLKQILNAEEEIKRRSLVQSPAPRGATPLVENGPVRLNVEVNFGNDLVADSGPGSCQSAPVNRPFCSPSSLSRSPFVHNQRGQLGHTTSLPPLLPLPGNNNNYNYMASSPSPASGGSSVFRDSRFSAGPN